jgi:3-deoxy-manno-octulosonate cytidylyltransferase (CMP-KDO synthetase)
MSKKLSIVAVIPARYNSTRFPGKPLAKLVGKPMIQHVYERTRRASLISDVLVATDDERIGRVVEEFGGRVVMTSPDHLTGTDRVAEAAVDLDAEVVVNVQGDEPLISPQVIDQAVQPLLEDASIQMTTLAHRIEDSDDLENPDVVKVCVDQEGYALSFSRTGSLPECQESTSGHLLRHIGLYVYRRPCLLSLAALKPTAREWTLGLEQLRPLEYGCRIKVVETEYVSLGVDRPQDLEKAERILQRHKETSS